MNDAEMNSAMHRAAVSLAKTDETAAMELLDAFRQLLDERNAAYAKIQRYYDTVYKKAWQVAGGAE